MLLAIYIRVSTKKQEAEGYSLEAQERDGKAFAKENNLEYKVYKDVLSGAKSDRNGYQNMLKDIETDKVKAIWINDWDRMARDIIVSENLKRKVIEKGIAFYEKGNFLDFNDEGTDIATTVKGKVAETERKRIKNRLKNGANDRFDEGKKVYPRLYGWEADGYDDTGHSMMSPAFQTGFGG